MSEHLVPSDTSPLSKDGNVPTKVIAKDGHEYHVSSTANAKVAPTNEATLSQVVEALPKPELDFVTIVHYEYGLQGEFPDDAYLRKMYGYSDTELTKFWETPALVQALTQRGLPVEKYLIRKFASIEDAPEPVKLVALRYPKLSPVQLVVANALIDLTDTRSEKKKLQDFGVSPRQYQTWMRDEDFRNYLRERVEALVGDSQHEAMLSLMDRVRAGDMKAIAYYHELTGRFTQQTSSASQTTTQQTNDLHSMIIRIIEIIVDEVDDPQLASRISDRLKGLAMGHQVANAAVGTVVDLAGNPLIPQPEIAPAREITPEIQNLMNQGVGYDS